MPTAPSPDAVQQLDVANIRPNPRNPRKLGLDTPSIAEMLRSIQAEGLLEPILVRVVEATPLAGTFYELIAGERRWRAFVMMKAATIPARVLEADEAAAASKCLVSFLQSKSATPMEEAIGYSRALDLADREGAKVFTIAELSRRTGRDLQHICRCLLLCDLSEAGQKSVLGGDLSFEIAVSIARIPDASMRAAALKQVMAGTEAGQPYTVAGVRSLLKAEYMRDLRGAPFDRNDAGLLRAAGPCSTCPHRTGANPDRFGPCKGTDGHTCMRPDCYRAKVEASRVKLAEKLMDDGIEVLDAETCEVEFPAGHKGLRFDSPYVVLTANVPAELLKKEVAAHGSVTWAELLRNAPAQAPQLAGFDQAGDTVRLVDRKLAIAAVDADEKKHLFRESDRKAVRITKDVVSPAAPPPEDRGQQPEASPRAAPSESIYSVEQYEGLQKECEDLAALLAEVAAALKPASLPRLLEVRVQAKLHRYGKAA